MGNDLISIIVPVYNVEQYLAECLESILNQTYKNIEVILINDGSTDKSEEICLIYSQKDKRIRYFYKQNSGVAATRNFGLKMSKGRYITFVDSDDCVSKNFIEILYDGVAQTGCKIVQCALTSFAELPQLKCNLSYNYEIIDSFEYLSRNDITGSSTLWSKIYDRDLFNEIEFPNGRIHEDIAVIYRLIDKCDKIAITEDKIYCYRVNYNGITKKKYGVDRIDIIDAFYEEALYYKEKGYKELYINKSNDIVKVISTFLSLDDKSFVNRKEFEKCLKDKYLQIRKNVLEMPIKRSFYVVLLLSRRSLIGFRIASKIKNAFKVINRRKNSG